MNQVVTIQNTELPVVEYSGERVVTLTMMDTVHQRAEGTAGRNFREHRARLIEGEDFYQVSSDEIRRNNPDAIPASLHRNDVVLLTESGYLMLVKSFTDDLAWDVQRSLVNGYFKPSKGEDAKPIKRRKSPASALAEAKAIDFIGNMVAQVPGTRPEMVAVIKLNMIEECTGIPATGFRLALPAIPLERLVKLNPTQIGQRIEESLGQKTSAQAVNKALLALGLQQKTERGWVPTEEGMKHGESRPYQASNKHVGDQIDWYESVVALVEEYVTRPDQTVVQLRPNASQGALA